MVWYWKDTRVGRNSRKTLKISLWIGLVSKAADRVTYHPSSPGSPQLIPRVPSSGEVLQSQANRCSWSPSSLAVTLKYPFYLAINVSLFNCSYSLSFFRLNWLGSEVPTPVPISSGRRTNYTSPAPRWWEPIPVKQRPVLREDRIRARICDYYNLSEMVSDYLVNSVFLCFVFPNAPGNHNPVKSALPH